MPSKSPFRVLHVSGQDENFKAAELNIHSPTTKGWLSSRFCLYPQDIVLQLEKRTRLRKIQILSHQYHIATKVEFYVGDVPEGTTPTLQQARYTRLGYVKLSDNAQTTYKARELKSVHVDAVGTFVKFVIHKNHINKHNLYNQVGIVALNVIGDTHDSSSEQPDYDIEGVSSDPTLAGINRLDYISPLDDLAFDMYQDPEVGQIIRRLEKKKQEAVLQERFDYAKKLKATTLELQRVGEKLGKFEVEKRQAVENEDYDKAKLKKAQMDEYRLQVYQELQLHHLLEISGYRQSIDAEPAHQPTPPRLDEMPKTIASPRSPTPRQSATPYDDRPLPAIKRKNSRPELTSPIPAPMEDDRPLPTHSKAPVEEELPQEDPSGNVTGEPESMTEKDKRTADFVIEAFGLALVSKAYSKSWSFKEDAYLEAAAMMNELDPSQKEEAKNMMRAGIFLVNKALRDKVFAVFKAGLNLLRMILTEFVPNYRISKGDVSQAVEKTLPHIINRMGDTAARSRDLAKTFIIEESSFSEIKGLNIVTTECVKPFKANTTPRIALCRTEIVHELYLTHGLQNSGLSVVNIMSYCTQALQHTAGEVRESAERLIILLYKDVGTPVKNHLPADSEKIRKNVLYKQLFEAFDKIDGKPSKDDLRKQALEAEAAKQREIENLQLQLQQLKDMTGAKPEEERNVKANKDKKNKKNEKDKKSKKENEDELPVKQIENTCIFCNDKNEAYSEEGLDIHYWKSCPMLKRCSFCKQVVEIAGLTEHLLSECEAHDDFAKCPRCTEAIPQSEFDDHSKEKSCTAAEPGKNHCPLCHNSNIKSGEDGWKDHLMSKDGCKKNPRRLPFLSQAGKGAGVAAAPGKGKQPSKIPSRLPKR